MPEPQKLEIIHVCELKGINIDAIDIDFLKANFKFKSLSLFKGATYQAEGFFTPHFISEVGAIHSSQILESPFFATRYLMVKPEEETKGTDIAIKTHFMNEHRKIKAVINHLVQLLWFAHNNAASLLHAYSFCPTNPDLLLFSEVGMGHSKAEGTFEDVEFSLDDFKLAETVYDAVAKIQTAPTGKEPYTYIDDKPVNLPSRYHYVNQSKTNRIERCLSFLFMARSNDFLPLKISLYISVLECLFTTDTSEVTYRVSERTALYLGGEYSAKMDVFNHVKKCYNTRSQFFHGAPIKVGELEKLQILSVDLDKILRRVLTKVMLNDSAIFLQDSEKLSDYFNKLVFDTKP